MPHYKDGTEAKVGDLVKGRGYNVKHEIIGKVVNVRPGESCTLTVAYVGAETAVNFPYILDSKGDVMDVLRPHAPVHVVASIEYGDTKCFELLGRAQG